MLNYGVAMGCTFQKGGFSTREPDTSAVGIFFLKFFGIAKITKVIRSKFQKVCSNSNFLCLYKPI